VGGAPLLGDLAAWRSRQRSKFSYDRSARRADPGVNPLARQALTLTYSHLFLDEFQDTTQIQYDLVKTIFLGSETVVTAVGDNKQQIMRWAMAMDKPFLEYERDFAAKRTPLLNNYRSSRELVRIQHILAQALDAEAVRPVSKVEGAISGDSCVVWDFSSPKVEATTLAAFIAEEMKAQDLSPHDFVLLVRQKPGDYVPLLAGALAEHNIVLRNEAADIGPVKLQELLSEDLSELVISLIRLATSERAGRAWSDSLQAMSLLRGLAHEDDRARTRLGREIEAFVAEFKATYPHPIASKSDAFAVVTKVLDFAGRADLTAACPAYRQGDWMKKVAEALPCASRRAARRKANGGRRLTLTRESTRCR
jgi:superfamily I DNA/RNA helicase